MWYLKVPVECFLNHFTQILIDTSTLCKALSAKPFVSCYVILCKIPNVPGISM